MGKKTWEIWTNSLLPKSHYISKKSLYISATLTQLNISLSFSAAAAAAAKLRQSCLTLCDPMDGSPPGSPIPGILQARTLEWGAIAFSTVFF